MAAIDLFSFSLVVTGLSSTSNGLVFEIIATPGHTLDHIILYDKILGISIDFSHLLLIKKGPNFPSYFRIGNTCLVTSQNGLNLFFEMFEV